LAPAWLDLRALLTLDFPFPFNEDPFLPAEPTRFFFLFAGAPMSRAQNRAALTARSHPAIN
jgi:hypothetical protein